MNHFCFGNVSNELQHKSCKFKKNTEVPAVEIDNNNMRIIFAQKIISKTFAGYFGAIQKYIQTGNIKSVEIDFRNTDYINMFCISKIVLTIMETNEEIRYSILWPRVEEGKQNKMLRFLYNKGILNVLFENKNIINIVDGDFIESYNEVYDFSNCIDAAIFPYKVYQVDKRSATRYGKEPIKKTVNEVLEGVKDYFHYKQENNFENIENRLYLYLYEIIENIYEHAYMSKGFFGVLVTYDYLPKYLWKKDKENKEKYIKRCTRLQKENPLSLFGDIEDRYIGGISVWIDDIGQGIAQTVEGGYYQQMYRDTYLNGLNEQKRGRGKTKLNGLKLIGDEIANNGDYLWIHDCWHWVGTHCNELKTNIALEDESKKQGSIAYEHPFVKGCSYEIKINLARNSKEKRGSFNNFGKPLHVGFNELRELCKNALSTDFTMENIQIIDLYNSENHTKKTASFFEKKCNSLLYRSRAIRKERFKDELFGRIFAEVPNAYFFEELVVYDLSQTALFQIRALIETRQYSETLISHGIKTVVLLSTEFFVFVLEIEDGIFRLKKRFAEEYIEQNTNKLLFYFQCFQKNDDAMINSLISKNKKYMLICADIQWGDKQIHQYLDIENVLKERQIFTVLRKMLTRVSGMLASESRLCFIEEFLENNFSEYLNEFSDSKAPKVYVGSLLLTKQTERKRAMKEDEKIYLFLHKESTIAIDNTYIILLNFPDLKCRNSKLQYRRIEATHRIERYREASDEFKFYLSDRYESLVQQIDFQLGLHSSGLFSVMQNLNLREAFKRFIIEQLVIIIEKYEFIDLEMDENLIMLCGQTEHYIEEIKEEVISRGNRRLWEKKFVKTEVKKDSAIVVYLTLSIELMRLLELKSKPDGYIVISIFNEIRTTASIDKLISTGYLPFLPIFYKEDSIVRDDDIKTFKAFYSSLVPALRKEVEILFDKTQGGFNFDFLIELHRYFNRNEKYSVLYDAIIKYIRYSTSSAYKDIKQTQEYNLLLSIILWQEQKIRTNHAHHERLLESILTQLEQYKDEGVSILLYYCMLVLYIFHASLDIKTIEAHREEIKQVFRFSKNPFLKIIFANILEQWNTLEFRKELNEIFVGNDIFLYYQTLYQNTFNNFGEDHDSLIYKYCKNKQLTDEEIQDLPSLINECVSLLKLTKPYNENEEKLIELENEFKKFERENDYGFEFREKCEVLRNHVQERFVILDVVRIREDLKKFIIERIWNGAKTKNTDTYFPELSEDFIICPNDKPKQMIKLLFPDDHYVIDELVFLFLDAVKYSNNVKITNASNQDKQSVVWVKCYVENGGIVIKFFNYLSEDYDEVLERIQSKKRVGKTHLEKFNIAVTYRENPQEVQTVDGTGNTIETKIVIPYFS